MFYLIDEQDGLHDESIVLNVNKLFVIYSNIENFSSVKLTFRFPENKKVQFSYRKETCFNVNALMKKISQLQDIQYASQHLVLSDIDNINTLHNEQFYLHKFSDILVRLDSILLCYTQNGATIIFCNDVIIKVKETPKEIFDIIQSNIVS